MQNKIIRVAALVAVAGAGLAWGGMTGLPWNSQGLLASRRSSLENPGDPATMGYSRALTRMECGAGIRTALTT
jgi:hypothetical protein